MPVVLAGRKASSVVGWRLTSTYRVLGTSRTPAFDKKKGHMLIKNPVYSAASLPLGAVILSEEYKKLNLAQGRFVVSYIDQAVATGVYDAVDSIRRAYGQSIKTPELRAYQILRNKKVKKVLDLHFRRSELDSILSELQRAARKSAKMKGGLTPATKKALEAFAAFVAREKSNG